MVENVFAPPRAEGPVVARSESTLRRFRIVARIQKALGGLCLAIVALAGLGIVLDPDAVNSDALLGASVVAGLGAAFIGSGVALKRGHTWPQLPLGVVVLLITVLLVIGLFVEVE